MQGLCGTLRDENVEQPEPMAVSAVRAGPVWPEPKAAFVGSGVGLGATQPHPGRISKAREEHAVT